ncbi:citrate lyase acyl carrier protein [Treponema putidum]|uniref:Citrate lyase acyl carrier protein n=1 Tax=Treponema putidum TaxID=221027 RepID=A0AAE9MS34_9SPIR|nr:citrate lyase acyl carrier protein [Treponema putidum]AIN94636.1 citrate lyase subunit gamma [Treponema putidum]TWI78759.1 citrate lyase subunit gamma (acyl carrier protein) [Treponema putidum]UTY28659.1 citrate lyase acyl carrier protein [Treponema putidum]UTY31094.1 citrate lyase acyl carrier protein [Treponema putidum]UTY33524.1 citrate lyase acyl carrier protein [Treponema putidum]
MQIKREAVCGTLQSNDCLVRVEPSLKPEDGIELDLKSSVLNEFGAQIKKIVQEVLDEFEVKNAKLFIEDKGALDCTIKARVETALRRANEK